MPSTPYLGDPRPLMLSLYDYLIIAVYLLFVSSMGWVFRHFNKGSNDYFAGGFRMSWWLLGTSTFISNFSCWTFTGAAQIAYSYGLLILGYYVNDVIGFALAALWFAPRFRQLRLVTAIDGVRLRFGRFNEQFFNWIGILSSLFQSAVGLVGLSIILHATFNIPQALVVVITGIVVLLIALVGGNWAVAASDFVQLLLLASVTIVIAILAVVNVGGVSAFLHQIPQDHWQVFKPLGSVRYDWLFFVSGWAASFYWRNHLGTASKYVAARDSTHARKSALVPMVGYLIMPFIWFIPPLAAFTLVPDLAQRFPTMKNPGEAAYIAVSLKVLPQGLLGLLVAAMFSVTIANMDVALNKNAGLFVKNFYQPWLRKHATDRELFVTGQIATLICGMLVTMLAMLLVTGTSVTLFDAYQYLNAYLWMPVGIPLILGMLVRRVPSWAAWSTVLFGLAFSAFLYEGLPLAHVRAVLQPIFGQTIYSYAIENKFTMTNLIGIPGTTLFFLGTRFFYKPGLHQERHTREFFRRMEKPIDFQKEVGADNSEAQARMLGMVTLIYGALIALILLVPNNVAGRLSIMSICVVMFGVGTALTLHARRLRRTQPHDPHDAFRVEAPQAK